VSQLIVFTNWFQSEFAATLIKLIEHVGEAGAAIEAPLELGEVARHVRPAEPEEFKKRGG
jgi:hypothetical protein